MVCLVVFITSEYNAYTKRVKPIEFDRVYANDPTKCGKCGYDVVHIQSDACPECGWALPRVEDLKFQSPDVWKWWKKGNWEIEYLEENSQKKVRRSVFIGLGASAIYTLIAIAIMTMRGITNSFLGGLTLPVIFMWLMTAHCGINFYRIKKYHERVGDKSQEGAAESC